MSEQPYTPTTSEVRQVWGEFSDYGGLVDRPSSGLLDDRYAEFDTWLGRVLDAARLQGLRQGWGEGHDAATDEAPDGVWPDAWIDAHNPYRQEAGQ